MGDKKMPMPHKCRSCGATYDGSKVEVVGRYADCDMWKAPCCGVTHDTRMRWGGPSWARMGYDDLNAYRREERDTYPPDGWMS